MILPPELIAGSARSLRRPRIRPCFQPCVRHGIPAPSSSPRPGATATPPLVTPDGGCGLRFAPLAAVSGASKPLLAITCLWEINSLTGSAPESFDALRQLLDDRKTVSVEQRRWTLTVLAEIAAKLDGSVEAEALFKNALSIVKPSAYLLGMYADFLIDKKPPRRGCLGETTRIDSLLLRLALAHQLLKCQSPPADAPANTGTRTSCVGPSHPGLSLST